MNLTNFNNYSADQYGSIKLNDDNVDLTEYDNHNYIDNHYNSYCNEYRYNGFDSDKNMFKYYYGDLILSKHCKVSCSYGKSDPSECNCKSNCKSTFKVVNINLIVDNT